MRKNLLVMAFAALFSTCLHAENKIDRIYVLSPEWIVLANDYMDETDQLIYNENKAEFDKALDAVIGISKDADVVDRAKRYKQGKT